MRKIHDSAMAVRLNGSDPTKRESDTSIHDAAKFVLHKYCVVLSGRNQCLVNVITQLINNVA
jgi:hypothetical protein